MQVTVSFQINKFNKESNLFEGEWEAECTDYEVLASAICSHFGQGEIKLFDEKGFAAKDECNHGTFFFYPLHLEESLEKFEDIS